MNCFQFDYFCGYHTAPSQKTKTTIKLWIAFNLITFVDITQHSESWKTKHPGCELLSIWLLLWISHSTKAKNLTTKVVVNCFQFDYFCGYHTANKWWKYPYTKLWIAFNLITFVDITQPTIVASGSQKCCELLSIWLLLWISHSFMGFGVRSVIVVNCFQFDYFCGYHTAAKNINIIFITLWIAFNLITFVDITQPQNKNLC